ncbi:MAG: PEP/pyruvate-binding domain-containing protein [Candidatus Limnocylindria bacterium]
MSQASLRRLAELRETDAAEVGGKAASLGELLAIGARVPTGIVLTTAGADLRADDRGSVLRRGVGELGSGPFAVRSSGTTEDGVQQSYAGIYESVLDVELDEVPVAVDRCLASAAAGRVAAYAVAGDGHMAVIVQRMIRPAAAGVALTADPINGDRATIVITAVRGTGERLVSGDALGDEWIVRDGRVMARRRPESAIDAPEAALVAREARRIADIRGTPQDIEWAIDADGMLWILQARPMTALPPQVSWDAPAKGAFTRQLRFGEWIAEPLTPLFESWLLSIMEERLHRRLQEWTGQRAPLPHHVVVNGWYFYSINWLTYPPSLPGMLWHLIREPRRVAGMFPPTVRHSIPIFEREWREDLLPRYRAAVAAATGRVEETPVGELPGLVNELAGLAGEYFASIAALAGAAYKMEMNLAGFYRRHLAPKLGGSHLSLLAGFEVPAAPGRHAVASLDWWQAPLPPSGPAASAGGNHDRVIAARRAAEEAASTALASSPRRLRAFHGLLAETQRLVPVREEHVGEFTLPWPVMRRAVLRIGEALVVRGAIADSDDVFFLSRDEALSALSDGASEPRVDTTARRARREEQARLVPPPMVGRLNPFLRRAWEAAPAMMGAVRSEFAITSGVPASSGRATGLVRVVRGPQDFDQLLPGEILVAPLTAPAWTPLFSRAAAVVTDVGSAAAHASIIAREYGIPAVVGCGDATSRLRTGMRVTVDGSTGNVEST